MDIPSWKIHEKWCEALGIRKEVCLKVNRIIDSPPHDSVDRLLKWGWARELFESGELNMPIGAIGRDDYYKVTSKLAEITNKFGQEGVKATLSHVALNRIAELVELGFDKEGIRKKLIEADLMKYIPEYDQAFADVFHEVKPSESKIKRRKKFEELARSEVYGVFYTRGRLFPAVPGLVYVKSKIKKEETFMLSGVSMLMRLRGEE